jgi:predicted PurR-regulated permease PerM
MADKKHFSLISGKKEKTATVKVESVTGAAPASGAGTVNLRLPIEPVANGAQRVLALVAVMVVLYFGKSVLVTLMVAILLAFVMEPLVGGLEHIRVPRPLGAFLAVALLLGICYTATYFLSVKAMDFAHQLPKYSQSIQGVMNKYKQKAEQIQKTTQKIVPGSEDQQNTVKVQQVETGWAGLATKTSANLTELLLLISFIPFLAFFMLTWQEHVRKSLVRLFPGEHRQSAHQALRNIAKMLKSFLVGNLMIGAMIGAGNSVAFWSLHLPYALFIGFISGYLSIVPYLGVILALVPPMVAGIGVLNMTGFLIAGGCVLASHLIALNVLYPKLLGKRLQLNPLVVTASLLFWGSMWGAMGLILAIPIMAALRIVCEHVEGWHNFGELLGEG